MSARVLYAGLLPKSQSERLISVKVSFHIGFNFLSAILVTIGAASEVQVLRLASPDAVVGAQHDSCRPALTGQGGLSLGRYCSCITGQRSPR
jgi:hypothetical protein